MSRDVPRLTSSEVYGYFQPSRCELRIYLRARGETEAPAGPYAEILRRLGERHEARHLESFPEVVNLEAVAPDRRVAETERAVAGHAAAIYHPRFRNRVVLAGREWEVGGEPDLLVRAPEGYAIRDVKLSRRLGEREHPEIHRQLELYGWQFEQTFGKPPARLEVFTGAGTVESLPFDGGAAALDLLRRIVEIRGASAAPYSPVGWTKCGGCGFFAHCWPHAVKNRDVALLPGVDQGLALALHERGLASYPALLRGMDEPALAALRRPWGTGQTKQVGKPAGDILLHARAFERQAEIVLAKPALPAGENFVMFDLEGLPPQLDELQKIYLWGLQVYGRRPGVYQPALAGFGAEGDAQGWREFLGRAKEIFREHADIPFIHWHHYETTNVRLYRERYGDPEGIAGRILDHCVDLLPLTRRAVILPLSSYSLKVVEKYIGFERTLEEYGGDWAMAKYIEAVETEDEADRQARLEEIMLYNKEDLAAMWGVWEWLSRLAPAG
ncbi:MAG: TM0106 family RecB-like putative nuclease [candidate division FCPU426 bacterium]